MNVSIGKLIDKYSVLEIKQRLVDVKKEMDAIVFCKKYIDMYPRLYKQLKYINQKIWDFMEEMHNNKNFKHAETILKLDNNKFRLKQTLNELTNSHLKDQKSFADDICAVFSKHTKTFYQIQIYVFLWGIQKRRLFLIWMKPFLIYQMFSSLNPFTTHHPVCWEIL